MRIVLCYPAEAKHLAQIQAAAPNCEIVNAGQEGIALALPTADIFCGHAKVPVPWDETVKLGRLKWIQSSAAGMDHCLVPSVIESDILVSSASGLFADQVAEHTIAMLTGLLRSMPVFYRAQQKREFIRRPTRDLHHQTVGIIGFGGNGKRLAEVLSVFKTRILATDLFAAQQKRPAYVEAIWPADRLEDLLPMCDVVILAMPLNADTLGMITSHQLAKMKKGAILVNVARGQVVVEADLVAALQSGHLSGAAVDVTEVEPLAVDSPLWAMPNVVVTPHVGAQSARRIDDTTDLICDNLRRYFGGQRLRNVVDKRLGFPVPEQKR